MTYPFHLRNGKYHFVGSQVFLVWHGGKGQKDGVHGRVCVRRIVALSLPARSSRSPAHGLVPPTAPGLRLRGGCGAMLSSRAAPPSHPPRHASAGGVRAPSRSSRTVHSTAPCSAYIQSQDIHETTVRMKSSPSPARSDIFIPHTILIEAGRQGRSSRLAAAS